MKRILLMSFIFVMSISFSFGQLISEGDRSMSQGYNNAFSMELRDADKKNVEKLWQKLLLPLAPQWRSLRQKSTSMVWQIFVPRVPGCSWVVPVTCCRRKSAARKLCRWRPGTKQKMPRPKSRSRPSSVSCGVAKPATRPWMNTWSMRPASCMCAETIQTALVMWLRKGNSKLRAMKAPS